MPDNRRRLSNLRRTARGAPALTTAKRLGSVGLASVLVVTVSPTILAQPAISYLDDVAVIMEYDSVFDVHTAPDPEKYPDQRSQPGKFTTNRLLEDLESYVHSDAYDFVLLYTLREVPGWIHAGRRYSAPDGKNIGQLNSASGSSWKPGNWTGWEKLRSAPEMNSIDFIDRVEPNRPNYGGSLTVFHEIFHYWGPDITGNYEVGPREWETGDPLAWLVQSSLHWSWNFLDPAMPGIMYSGPTSSLFNAFDLYLMGLINYAEATTFSYMIYELDPVTQGVPNDPALIHELTIDHLIDSLALRGPEYYGGDGRRIPEIDETAKEFRALVVVVKGKDDVFTETQAALIRDMVADLPGAWEIATWGRSKMQARVQLPIPAAPSFILHPFSQTVEAGQQAAFDALAKGTPRPVYQWQHSVDGVSWNDLSEDAIHSGVTTGTLTISDPDVSMSGHRYRVLAGNSEGSATSVAATLTVTESSGGRPNAPSTPDIKNTYSGGFSVFWSPAFGADGYYLELATDPAFENRVPGYDPMDVGHVLSTKISGIPSATYFVRVSAYNGVGTGPASFLSTVTTVPSRFTNLSTRGQTEVRDGVLILGFVISGNQPKQILVRAAGPALIQFGITEAVEDPRLVLYDARQRVLPPGNDDWDYTDPDLRNAFAQVSAFDFSDASSDSAMLMTLDPGLYSVHSQTVTGTAGVTIIELYELDEAGEFSNVSARAYVGTGDFVLIPGAVMAGGTSRVLVRAVGRTLGQAPFNVPGVLDDPVLAVHPLSGPAIATNDDWEENGPEAASQIVAVSNSVSAFPLPSGSPDAVILIDLASGPFTFAVSGKSGATGIVLLELYKAP